MNKAELVTALEERLGSRKLAADAVEALVDTITRSVSRGEKVAISGFGTFEKTVRRARVGRNPRTGEKVPIKKTSVPRFRPGTAFKGFVSEPRSMPKPVIGATKAVTSTLRGSRAEATVATPAKTTRARKTTGAAAKTAKSAPARTATKTAAEPTSARTGRSAGRSTTARSATSKAASKTATPTPATKSTKSSASKASAASTGAAKTTKTSAAKTSAAKTSAAKTGAAKTGTAKTGTAKTGTAKTGTAKTGTAKTECGQDGQDRYGQVERGEDRHGQVEPGQDQHRQDERGEDQSVGGQDASEAGAQELNRGPMWPIAPAGRCPDVGGGPPRASP